MELFNSMKRGDKQKDLIEDKLKHATENFCLVENGLKKDNLKLQNEIMNLKDKLEN